MISDPIVRKESIFRIALSKKKGLVGLGLGLLSLCVLYLLRDVFIASESDGLPGGYLIGVPLAAAFTVVGFLRIESGNRFIRAALNLCWSLAIAVAAIFGAMAALERLGIWRMPLYNMFLSVVFFFAMVGIVYTATGRFRMSVNIVNIFQLIIAVINSFVWQFRGREFLFSDLSAAGTALAVASEYTPVFSLKMAIGLFFWLLVSFTQFCLPRESCVKNRKVRIAALLAAVGLGAFTVVGSESVPIQTWGSRGSGINGFYVNFIISIRDSIIHAPEGYSNQSIAGLERDYTAVSAETDTQPPNIIVIMNESFVDLRVFGENYNVNQPVTPFFDSLKENTIRGYALSSAFGGHTANSEFEFLTGFSMGLLPVGSIPYQQYISEDLFSLAWLMQNFGYRSVATHPYFENSWARKTSYPYIGFEESTFIQDYPQENLLREWISDQEMYEYVLNDLRSHEDDTPQFIFGITMQNHGGYDYTGPNYTQTIELDGYSQNYPWAEQYLSVLHESDKALEYLLTELENYEEDTVVVFFGDHFPGIETALFSEIHGDSIDELEEIMLQYKVPFAIWANYDIEEQEVECTSLNYLGRYLLETAGLELPPYYQFLAQLEEKIPAMNQSGYYSLSQGGFITYDAAQGAEKEWLDKYRLIQYNGLFDTKNRSALFFGDHLPDKE